TGFDQAGNLFNEYRSPPRPTLSVPSLPGYDTTSALAMNAAGQIVGNSAGDLTSTGWLNNVGWIYSGGRFTILPFSQAAALGINASGQVVGNYFDSDSNSHAFIYDNGHATNLGTLGGASSAALGLNDQGQVVGYSTIAGAPGTPAHLQPTRAF